VTATPDTAASDRLILVEHSSAVLAYLERRSPNLPTALAHFRATMLHAWLKIDRLRSIDNRAQRVWLLNRAARTLAAAKSNSSDMHSTKTRFTRRRLADSTVDSDSPRPLQAEMTRLPANQRELIALVHWDDLSVVEAGKVLGLGPAVARAQYAAGRANLRATLEGARI
jgi:RNA polymerase sigma-70 factor (ECF subfamily)